MEIEQIFKFIGMVATGVISITSIIWAFRKWWIREEHFPRVAFDLKVNVLGKTDGMHIFEVVAVLENKGLVPLKICDFICEIRGINEGDSLKIGGLNIRNQLDFKHVIQKGWFIPSDWAFSFVYPSVKSDYSYITMVPTGTKYALVKGSFKYYRRYSRLGSSKFHHATAVLKTPD